MTATKYQPENGEFSNVAHLAAQRLIYPQIFAVPAEAIQYEATLLGASERGSVYDGELGIDRIVKVTVNKLHGPLKFVVQERFRRPAYASYRDITITEWNGASNLPSELYKISAGLFVYGYYDAERNRFIDAIAFHVSALLHRMVTNSIAYRRNKNNKQQDFLSFTFTDLAAANCVAWWQNSTGNNGVVYSSPKPSVPTLPSPTGGRQNSFF